MADAIAKSVQELTAFRRAKTARKAQRQTKRSQFRAARRLRRMGDRVIAAWASVRDFFEIEERFAC